MPIRAVVSGRVQGVGFRWFVRQEARRLGVSGWVRNLPTGEVEVVADGPPSQLRRLLEHVRVGPPGSHVESVSEETVQHAASLPFPFSVLK